MNTAASTSDTVQFNCDQTARSSNRIIISGFIIIAVLIGGFGMWAGLAPLASGVLAGGVVVAEENRSTVQHLEGGIVKDILVKEGESVVAGQVLVRLDDVQIKSKLGSLQAEFDGLQAREARLTAEQRNAQTITYPADLLSRSRDQRASDIMAGETTLFEERRAALNTSLHMISQQQNLYKHHTQGSMAQIKSSKTQLAISKQELVGLETLFAKGYVAKTRLLKLKREIARLDGVIGEKTSQVSQAKIKVLESEVEATQTKTDFRKDVISELRDVQGKLFNLEEQILAAKDTLTRLDIKAPRDGVVLDLQFHALNTVIMAGAPVLDIVPNGGALIVDAKIRPTDVDNVSVGAEAEVRFSAFRQRTTPSIFGTVQTVSADTLIDPATSEPYYTARVFITEDQRQRIGDRSIVSGMPADVTVLSEDRTLIEYMIEPLSDVLARSFKE